ncbi:hypothetical protein KSX_04150 [Ktedonospora formicarum]|uniref:Uncharacterized protein n=1 Tax=Ktedonospora formicarum TaxID=2778364 RepID=A0A8J3MN25_9CHLR|nr:hypothetical protein KSX_04150 [Ktedonospora formicarum]
MGNPQPDYVIRYFTPFNQHYLMEWDYDLGSSGNLLLPDQTGPHRHLMLGVSKSGRLSAGAADQC